MAETIKVTNKEGSNGENDLGMIRWPHRAYNIKKDPIHHISTLK